MINVTIPSLIRTSSLEVSKEVPNMLLQQRVEIIFTILTSLEHTDPILIRRAFFFFCFSEESTNIFLLYIRVGHHSTRLKSHEKCRKYRIIKKKPTE